MPPVDVTYEEVLTAIVGIVQTADDAAVVVNRPVLGLETEGASLDPYMRDDGVIDAWVITPAIIGLERGGGQVAYNLAHAARARRYTQRWAFTIRCYLQYYSGDASVNSHLDFANKLLTVQRALAPEVKLGLVNELVLQHNDLQFTIQPMYGANDLMIHHALGRLEVLSYRSITSV